MTSDSLTIKAELHCHNIFSNFHVGDKEPPYDCNISIRDQLQRALDSGINSLFVTNHNTLDGYAQLRNYQHDHEKFKGITIFPAEEITIDTGAHVLAYGITSEIKPGMTLSETLDEIRRQDAISSAPHPFSLLDALRTDAQKCDMIEVFNSNNIDIISNARASAFALEHDMTQVCGSDSHVLSTLGRCVNVIQTENTLDDALFGMRHDSIRIEQTGYAEQVETLEHIKYKIDNSKDYLISFIKEEYPNMRWFLSFLLYLYNSNPDSFVWPILYKIAIRLMRRLSAKINYDDFDPAFMKDRNLGTMFKMAIS